MTGNITFRWLGVSGIEFRADDQILAIDPFFSRPPAHLLWFGHPSVDRVVINNVFTACDAILISHAHYDHLMDVPFIAEQTGGKVLGSANTCKLLRLHDVPHSQVQEIRAGQRLEIGAFEVHILPAEHRLIFGRRLASGPIPTNRQPPIALREYRMDSCFSFHLQVGPWQILDHRSQKPEPSRRADILFVAADHTPGFYEELLPIVQPQIVVPNHWDDFLRPLSKPIRPMLRMPKWGIPPLQRIQLAEFQQAIERAYPQAIVLIPKIFQPYQLDDFSTLSPRH